MSSFYTSRSNINTDINDESFSTIELVLSSQKGAIPLPPYKNINAGFTCVLANPIILDISHRYVIALIKRSYDISQYTEVYTTFDFFCDIIEYQYDHDKKTQLLYESYDKRFSNTPNDYERNPNADDVINLRWKFINPTQKVIDRISFWVLDEAGNPLISPTENSYPTKLDIMIKKVNSRVVATTLL